MMNMCSKAHCRDGMLPYWCGIVTLLAILVCIGIGVMIESKPDRDDCVSLFESCNDKCAVSWCAVCPSCNSTCDTRLCDACTSFNISTCVEKVCPSISACAECRNEYVAMDCDTKIDDYSSGGMIAGFFGIILAMVLVFSLCYKYPCTDVRCG